MSLRRCIPEMSGDGRLNRDQAERLGGLFDDLERDYSTRFGRETAEAMASEEAVKRFAADAALKRRQAALQVKVQQTIASDVRTFRGDNPAAAAIALFTNDSRASYVNAERLADAITGQAHAMMSGVLERFSRNIAGQVRNRAELSDFVREAFGEATGNATARELAQAWGETAEMLRLRFNAAGGGIGKLEKWGLPQVHNMLAVRDAPYAEWRDFIAPLLDRQQMKDAGGNPLTPQQLEIALREVYETISTDGWNTRKAGGFNGSKMANRKADSRFLIFKDAEAWMAYSRRFGRPTSAIGEAIDPDGAIFDAMTGHIRSMATDIALMERLGPNPTATVRWLKDGLMIEATQPRHQGGRRIQRAEIGQAHIDALYGELSGANNKIANQTLANVAQSVRSFQVAAKLGSAVLSAVSDVGFQHVTAKFNGLSAARIVANYGRLLNPASTADRQLAQRLWMINETATRMGATQSRFSGDMVTGELAGRMAEGVMRLSGLNAWTQAGRWAFGMEFWSHLTSEAPRNWQNISTPFRKALQRYGIGERDWDIVRATPLEDAGAAGKWILPDNISDHSVAERLAMLVATETDFAVPTANLRITSAINSTLRRGTVLGETGRSMLLFKAFPVTVMWMHGRRIAEQQFPSAISYAARLAITTTLMGALAMQLKNLLTMGKDLQSADDPAFWGKAFAQGGGAGLVGDFVNSQTNRYEQTIQEWIMGPVASSTNDIIGLVRRRYAERYGEDAGTSKAKSATARSLRRVVQGNTPGSSIWYLKLAFQREVLDQMQAEMDPEYWESFDRMERRAEEDGAGYWWRPGKTAPERAPDLAGSAP